MLTAQGLLLALLLMLPFGVAGLLVLALRAAQTLLSVPSGLMRRRGWRGIAGLHFMRTRERVLRHLTPSLIPLPQVFETLAPQKWVVHALQSLRPQLDVLVDDVVDTHNSVFWENMPISLKNRMYERMHREMPGVLDDIIEELGDQADLLVDIPALFEVAERDHPDLVLSVLGAAASPSLKQAEWRTWWWTVGAALPFCLLYLALPWDWLLLLGLWGSTMLALRMRHRSLQRIWSRPMDDLHPITAGRDGIAHHLAEAVFTPRHWITVVMDGPGARNTQLIIKRNVGRLVETLSIRSFLQVTMGADRYVQLKRTLSQRIQAVMRQPFDDARFNRGRVQGVRQLMKKRLERRPAQEMLDLIQPMVTGQWVIAATGISLITAVAALIVMVWIPNA